MLYNWEIMPLIIPKKLRIKVVKQLIRRYEILYENEPAYGYNNKQQVYYELIEYWEEKLKIYIMTYVTVN